MKYLVSGLKSTNVVLIDHPSSESEIQSDIEDVDEAKMDRQKQQSRSRFCPIAPIRKIPIYKPPQRHRHKIQQIEISDSQQRNSSQNQQSSIRAIMREPENQQTIKKRLVKVSNKCKIQRKQFTSTQCGICLGSLQIKVQSEIGRLQCHHSFCFDCILKNSKFSNRCPYCRAPYEQIIKGDEKIPVEEKNFEEQYDFYDEPCYVCGRNDDFDHLLECEYCESAFCHTYCDNRLESDIPPEESWYCLSCSSLLGH